MGSSWSYNLFVPAQPGPTTKTVQRVFDTVLTHGYTVAGTDGKIHGDTYAADRPFAEGEGFAAPTLAEAATILGQEGGGFSIVREGESAEVLLDLSQTRAKVWSTALPPEALPPIGTCCIWGYNSFFYEYLPGGGSPIGLYPGQIEHMERLCADLATTFNAYYGYFENDSLTESGPFPPMELAEVTALRAGELPRVLWGIQYFSDEYAATLPFDLMRELGATIEALPHGCVVKFADYSHRQPYKYVLELLNEEWRRRTGQPDLPPGRRS